MSTAWLALGFLISAAPSPAVSDGADARAPSAEQVVQPGTDIAALSLDDLLAAPVTVASRRAESTREVPAVVTVFTREEIVASGARDLSDLLWLVPGFSQNVDVENVLGLSVRGIWSYEGKVLLMVDGIDMTEQLYGNNPLGMHYLTQNIERVEIIRGPGSAVYGGNAGMAVISIITRGAKDLNGAEIDARYAQGPRSYADRSVGLNLAHTLQVGGGIGLSLSGYLGQGTRSDGVYTDSTGQKWDLADGKGLATNPMNVNAGVTWKGLSVRFLFDRYSLGSVDGYGPLATVTDSSGNMVPGLNSQVFQTVALDARYDFKLSDSLSIEPRLMYRHQLPWWTQALDQSSYYEKTTQRLLGSVTAKWAASETVHLLGGVEVFDDLAAIPHPEHLGGVETDFSAINPSDPNHAQLTNFAAFAQLQWDNAIANLTLGGRAEYHSVAGASFVPRLAATKRIDRLTAKLLFSGAFRAPSFENLNTSFNGDGKLNPERIWVAETELSYQMLDWAILSVNAFAIDVDQPIVFEADPNDPTIQGYRNSGHVGSRGVEGELVLRGAPGFLRLSYSWNEASPGTDVPNFLQVDGTRTRLVGMPGHKFTLFGHLKLPKNFSLNATSLLLGERKGSDANGLQVIYPAALVINANVRWEAPDTTFARGFFASAGVDDALDAHPAYIQAYNGGHPPIPGRGRDFFLRVGYTFSP
ncbi:MAG: TonB-dependent receptor plug domain-containing protein [Myxococcaceae bacterium]